MAKHYRWMGPDLQLRIHVSSRASRDQIGDLLEDRLKVSITAPPVDGKANKHLIKYSAKQFGVAVRRVTLMSGRSSRDKSVLITEPASLPAAFQIARM